MEAGPELTDEVAMLVMECQTPQTPEEMMIALEAALAKGALTQLVAQKYAKGLVDNGFDSPEALKDITDDQIKEIGVAMGHRKLLRRALFKEVEEVEGAPPELAHFFTEWPSVGANGLPEGTDLHCYALALAAHFKVAGGAWKDLALEVMDVFNAPTTPIAAGYPSGGDMDLQLAHCLLTCGKKGIPKSLMAHCRAHIEDDRGLEAWKDVCAAVRAPSKQQKSEIKRKVRYPRAAANV